MKEVLYQYLRDTICLFGFCAAFIDYTPFFSYTILVLIILGFLLINNFELRYKLVSGYMFGIIVKNGFLLSYLLGTLSLFLAYLINWLLFYTPLSIRLIEPLESQVCMIQNITFTYYKTFKTITNIDYKNLLIKLGILLIRLYTTYTIINLVTYNSILFFNLIFFIGLNIVQNFEIKENNLNFMRKNLQLFILHLCIISLTIILSLFAKNYIINFFEFINSETLLFISLFCILLGICSFLLYQYFSFLIIIEYLWNLSFLVIFEMLLNCIIVSYVIKLQDFNGLLTFAIARIISIFSSARTEIIIYPFTYALIYIVGYHFIPIILALVLLKQLKFIEIITILIYITLGIVYLNYSLIALAFLLTIGLFYKYSSLNCIEIE